MTHVPHADASSARHRGVLLAAGAAAILVLALFPVQMSVFALAWPPPDSAEAYFDLLHERPLVGLLSLDVLLMADWLLLLVVWAGLYVALRAHAPRTMLVVAALVLVSTAAYFVSNSAFEMLALARDHAAADGPAERDALLLAGERALARFEGPWFTASYVLSGLAAFLASLVMWRAPAFGRAAAGIGVVYGALQLVPPNLGAVGMAVSLLSLPPMLAWLVLLARALLARARRAAPARGRRDAPA